MVNTGIAIILITVFLLIKLVFRRNHRARDGAPFVPLNPSVVSRIMDLADVKKGDVFYDLGSGDGRLVIAAALKGATAYGVEIDPLRVLYARLWIFVLRLSDRATIIRKNIFDVDLSSANVITMYLLQETNNALKPKLEKEVKIGARIVGVAFDLPGWEPVTVDPHGPIYGPLYLYIKTGHYGV